MLNPCRLIFLKTGSTPIRQAIPTILLENQRPVADRLLQHSACDLTTLAGQKNPIDVGFRNPAHGIGQLKQGQGMAVGTV